MGKLIRYTKTWPDPPPSGDSVEELAFSDPQCLQLASRPQVQGTLALRGLKRLTEIPEPLFCGHSLILTGCPDLRQLPKIHRPLRLLMLDGVGVESLPDDLPFAENAELILQNCSRLQNLPAAVSTGIFAKITIRNCPQLITPWPALAASEKIILTRCPVTAFENPLRAPSLSISRFPELERLGGELWAGELLHLAHCPKLSTFAAPAKAMRTLLVEHCGSLTTLPEGMRFHGQPAELILRGCPALTGFPDELSAGQTALPEPAGDPAIHLIVDAEPCPTGKLPPWAFPWQLRVRRVLLEPATVLNPEGINPLLVLTHPNAEVRRILLENLGMARLEAFVAHTVLENDTDAGGPRRLIQFHLPVRIPSSRSSSRGRPQETLGPFLRTPPPTYVTAPAPPPRPEAGSGLGKFLARLFGLGKPAAPAPGPPVGTPDAEPPVSLAQAIGEKVGTLVAESLSGAPPRQPSAQASDAPPNTRPASFLDCRCPSTGRRYLLPVPPTIRSCHAAAAWMAGFERADDYAPLLET